ncbi:hypothetical protein FACS1894167_10570 [Synergistales bacterium]|nr:hypothetical protein FACS1894167_10570 [Synergistales bacterium]
MNENSINGVVNNAPVATQNIITADNIGSVNSTVIFDGSLGDTDTNALLDNTFSSEYCNWFIVKDVSFSNSKNCFVIGREKALRHKSSETFDIFDERIKKFPSLFITANGGYKKCKDPNQSFYYGMVTSVSEQGRKIEICFRKLWGKPMSQLRLNEIAFEIGINSNDGRDVLDGTNWIIKRMDLRKTLQEHGLIYR